MRNFREVRLAFLFSLFYFTRRNLINNHPMNKKINILYLLSFLLLSSVTGCSTNAGEDRLVKTTVQEFDIKRYLGAWYEIGRYQHSFEKDLVGVTATYTLKEDGKIEVNNQGFFKTLEGELKIAKGKAKLTDEIGKLKVSFFLFFYAEYNILELDGKDYQWALVGSSTPGYLWILSRKPKMPEELYQMLLEKARLRGYDVAKIYRVPQK
jgi:lipocalin